MLLASQGRSTFALAEDYTNETRFPIYDRASQLGSATGVHYRVGAAYRRDFSGGTVVVNPTLSPVNVALGAEYVTAEGTRVTAVSLAATSGVILLSTGGGEPPPDIVPPETTITAAPPALSRSATASFSFVANEPGSPFECRLDGGAFAACNSPVNYAGLAARSHTFAVRAIDAAGNVDPTPAGYAWRVKLKGGSMSVLFTSGSAQTHERARGGAVRRVRLRIAGRVLARISGRPVSRVTLYKRTGRRWRAIARVRTRADGRFHVDRRLRTSVRSLRLHAVASSSGITVRSRIVLVGVRVRK